jgi:hypothetical protein
MGGGPSIRFSGQASRHFIEAFPVWFRLGRLGEIRLAEELKRIPDCLLKQVVMARSCAAAG